MHRSALGADQLVIVPPTRHAGQTQPVPDHVELPPPLSLVSTYPTIADAQERFLASLALRSPRTRETYLEALHRFNEWLRSVRVDPEQATTDMLTTDLPERFLGALVASNRYKRATLQTFSSGVRAYSHFLARRDLGPNLNYERVAEQIREILGRPTYRSPRIDKRIPLIVLYADNLPVPHPSRRRGIARLELLRDRALLHVLFCTGMRRAEVSGLNRADVGNSGLVEQALITGKGSKERLVFFDEQTRHAMHAYLAARKDDHAPLFLRHDNRRGRPGPRGERWRLSPQSVWGIVKRYARATGVPASTHHFRHAKASTLLNRGADLSQVQDILGHASPETTKRIYAHYDSRVLRDAFFAHSATPQELVADLYAHEAEKASSHGHRV